MVNLFVSFWPKSRNLPLLSHSKLVSKSLDSETSSEWQEISESETKWNLYKVGIKSSLIFKTIVKGDNLCD